MQDGTAGPIHYLNLEYFFRLLYESRVGITGTSTAPSFSLFDGFFAWVAHVWGVLGIVSFVFSIIAFLVLAYATIRGHQIRELEEHERWSTLAPAEAETMKDHSRWAHIQSLIESGQERDWREAIMEADIMLDDMLIERGYPGNTTSDRLKSVDPKKYGTLEDAWEAHKVRNQIAHQGSTYRIDDKFAYRTIKRYENVFREFGEI